MTDEFQRGLITGLSMQPLQVTTEHAESDPDAPDIYNISFEAHNLLVDDGVINNNGSWGHATINGNHAILNFNGNVSNAWYAITNSLTLSTNLLYKLSASHIRFYGRFGISAYGIGNVIYDKQFMNCACAYSHNDNHMLQNEYHYPGGMKSTLFMVVPHNTRSFEQTVNVLWCSDNLYQDAKEPFSIELELLKQKV